MDYEAIFIIRPQAQDGDSDKVSESLKAIISKEGGKVKNAEVWGKRSLPYKIKKSDEGVYHKVEFGMSPEKVGDLKRECGLNNDVLRITIIRTGGK
jgi:small subunit ribosomal protein S6